MLFSANPVGGGIPHGVFPEMGPGGNVGQLIEHRPRWAGVHETVQSSPDTKQKHSKAKADTAASEGPGAASSGLTGPESTESKIKGRKRGSVSWAPDLAKDLASESVSDSVSGSPTDIATHLDPGPTDVHDQAVKKVSEPDAKQARKFSANKETARRSRESPGEHWSELPSKLQ